MVQDDIDDLADTVTSCIWCRSMSTVPCILCTKILPVEDYYETFVVQMMSGKLYNVLQPKNRGVPVYFPYVRIPKPKY